MAGAGMMVPQCAHNLSPSCALASWYRKLPADTHHLLNVVIRLTVKCVGLFVRGDFSLSGSGCLSGVFSSRYLMPWFPVCARPLRNRAYRLVPGLMLRVPVIVPSCSFGVQLPDPPGIALRPFPSVI